MISSRLQARKGGRARPPSSALNSLLPEAVPLCLTRVFIHVEIET